MMTWKSSDAQASAFDVANPIPEFAPIGACQRTEGFKLAFAMLTSDEDNRRSHFREQKPSGCAIGECITVEPAGLQRNAWEGA